MTALDWGVLLATLGAIVAYGVWKTRHTRDMAGYLHGGYADKWPTIGLAVMATQASAITFLSTPGQAYTDGMRFLQFYFGLPLAMVVLSVVFVPRFYGLRVFTAYEYLEQRFDRKTRQLAAFLFLVQRGLSAGITIYAPAIVLSTVLGWSLNLTCVAIGALVILYTVSGGTRAVSQTQKHQMVVMLGGMAVAFAVVVARLPPEISFGRAVGLAGTLGKMNIVDFSPRLDSRYTFWSGITGGFFLALSYFGTDQSQVQRYLSGRSITESRLGLLFNGLFKVPMQFLILFVGVMVFVFHQFQPTPIFFNPAALAAVRASPRAPELQALEESQRLIFARQQLAIAGLEAALDHHDDPGARAAAERVRRAQGETSALRAGARRLVAATLPRGESNDTDYIFISFVMKNLPRGLVGLLLAVILCAAMSSTASELTALGGTSVIDFYKRSWRPGASDGHYLLVAQLLTAGWGALAVLFATLASMVDNLIQAVNILGSLFYGTILGLFLLAFFSRRVGATAVFVAALLSEAAVIAVWLTTDVGFLWFNVIGCALVVAISWALGLLGVGRGGDQSRRAAPAAPA
jgi:solute:Na+ symporter, SSS family